MVATPNKFFEQPTRGSLVGGWDSPLNTITGIVDNSFGGVAALVLSNSPVTLSSGQYQCAFLRFTGALTANVAITLPPVGSFYTVSNETTNSSNFYITIQTSVSGGRVIGLAPGAITDIMTDGTNARFRGLPAVGTYWDYAGSSTPAWIDACTTPPWLHCNGSAFSSAAYPALFTLLNGTTLPDFRGRTAFQLNDGTSRVQSSLSGLDGNTPFASGGAQSIALSSQHLPNTSFTVTDPGHNHTVTHNFETGLTGNIDSSTPNSIGNVNAATITINSAATGITVGTGGSGTPVSLLPPGAVVGIRLVRAA